MSLESWDPVADAQADHLKLAPHTLAQLIAYSAEDQLEELEKRLVGDESQTLSGLMKVDHGAWHKAAESLSDDDLLHLIRFFAVAENLPGWEAQDKSPVIPLAKCLRKRGQKLDKTLLQWLRDVNDNRFLPYGPL